MEEHLNPNLIQSLWIGGQLSNVERLCIQSFIDHGHEFHLYAYEEIKNAPKNAMIKDARSIAPEKMIFRNKEGWGKGSVTGFADLFRIMMVKKNGGWWVDMDVICLKPFNFTADEVFCTSYEGEYGSLINNCVFKSKADSEFLVKCMDYISDLDTKTMPFGAAGIFMFQNIVKELGLQHHSVPYQTFNPIGWRFVGEFILGKMSLKNRIKEYSRPLLKPNSMDGRRITSNAHAVHFWNEVWNYNKFDKNGSYHSDCLFERLKKKHNIY
ncbi:glycosyltransferase [Pedobacter duraquae]|uniref:Glycosyl transferase-like sugar-binding protein n=1 Tax=Pedobacter duraquae TaxID=425511 RepID=A0A4R6IM07_9SPHI|nr:glycosyltransferase [Pedobacter duraquae]TDO23153.1 glycosyl transferase-like sugar-binding protein [Pedobacter duraquae]